jgi:hypothetical protein
MRKLQVMGCLFLVLVSGALLSQSVPQLINYQGRLTDSSGQPLDGVTVDLKFSFYGSESGDTVFLSVLQEDVQITGGIYHVLIGSGTITPGTESTLTDVFQKHSEVWMGVKVDTDPEMTPLSRISSVSYSMMSDMAAQAGIATQVAPGSIMAGSIGEDCAVGEVISKTPFGWQCSAPGAMYEWTWMSGSNIIDRYGVYGEKGIPDPTSIPGSRYMAVSWTDISGKFWLFGGYGYASGGKGDLNDLWKWDGTNWTWMSGSSGTDHYGVYGEKGKPAAGNVPGSRYSPVSWTDGSGNLWLFGGSGYAESGTSGHLNDLWTWDGTYWTWMSGDTVTDQNGFYGIKGTPGANNVPGSRHASVSWTDYSGNLWLFGGSGYAESGDWGYLNDLWRWDGAEWTWMSGSDETDQNGVYGTKGTPAPANVPGARRYLVSWTDPSGNLWLFGGYGYPATGSTGGLNDLWKFK